MTGGPASLTVQTIVQCHNTCDAVLSRQYPDVSKHLNDFILIEKAATFLKQLGPEDKGTIILANMGNFSPSDSAYQRYCVNL